MYDSIAEAMTAIDEELETFQWAYPDRSENRGEVEVDRDTQRLVLRVWVRDNEDLEDETVKELHVSQDIFTDENAQDQIRSIIHNFLCHEADEQMWFGEERIFYPH